MLQKALFIDRDGTMNHNPPRGEFVWRWEDWRFIDNAEEALLKFTRSGYRIVVISNQSGVGRGLYTTDDVAALHERVGTVLKKGGSDIAAFYFCPHTASDECDCRKPKPGMILRAARELGIDLASSILAGDSARDIEAGKRAGVSTAFVWGDAYADERFAAAAADPDYIVRDLLELYAAIAEPGTVPSGDGPLRATNNAPFPSFSIFHGHYSENAELARNVLDMRPAAGIPQWMLHVMDIPLLEEIAGVPHGEYIKNPEAVYLAFQRNAGTCFIDQYIPRNPLTMTEEGFGEHAPRGATTGARRIELDGVLIDSPEAVVDHLQRFVFPKLLDAALDMPPLISAEHVKGASSRTELVAPELVRREIDIQAAFGPQILKVPYDGFQYFPRLRYSQYGYANYLMAYALYPELMEKDFQLQADAAAKKNSAAAQAIVAGGLPRIVRLDHDMTDSRGTLVDVKSLDRLWFPHFARAIRPLLDAGIRLLWHCDGNVMPMVERLIEAGIGGFQGFQYEDGVDYVQICRMRDRNGGPLMIWAGVSVTRTLPFGARQDVKKELDWLVENGPETGLCLGASSSIAPGTNRENVKTLIEGLIYYRIHGRK